MRTKVVAVLGVTILLSVLLMPGARAQKVLDPGAFAINPTGGFLRMRDTAFDLTPNPLPQCSDGEDNDGDRNVDGTDHQCVAGPGGEPATDDDSELVAGFQPKLPFELAGSIDAQGVVTIPKSGVQFPTIYVPLAHPVSGEINVVKASIVATHDATGTLNPLTGDAELRVRIRVGLAGQVFGVGLGYTCSIGTDSQPIDLNVLTTGLTHPPDGVPAIAGARYSTTSGSLRIVNNEFAVPGASGCPVGLLGNVNGMINQEMGIPSAPGLNEAQLVGEIVPAPAKAVEASISSAEPLSGPAPLAVTLDASDSVVAKLPATYDWEMIEGFSGTPWTTQSGAVVSLTFPNPGFQTVRLTVTDDEGDTSTVSRAFYVSEPEATTTTTSTTSTTTSTTTTAKPTTTTTAKPATTTTAKPTTTTTAKPATTTTAKPTTTTAKPATTTTAKPTTTITEKPATTTTAKPTTTTTAKPATTTTTAKPTTTTTTEKPTTTTTTEKPTTTTTAKPTTTTTTETPTTTTSTTTTTTAKPTTTTTAKPATGADRVTLDIGGSFSYSASSELLSGDLKVQRKGDDVRAIVGRGEFSGPSGEPASVIMNIRRLWMSDLWVGSVTVRDNADDVKHRIPYVGQVEVDGDTVSGSGNWISLGTFPNLFQPMTLDWSVEDSA